jgi:hypothetical protein
MRMHQTMGNQAVMRAVNYVRLNDPASSQQLPPVRGIASGVQRTLIQREEHDLEPRVDIENVGTAGEMKVEPRKVEIQEKDQKTGDPFGSTASHVTIEYAVDESGQVSVGSLRPNYTITIYTPYITSDEFIEKFTPLMQKLWEKYDGDIAAFSEDTEVRNFHYYDQTLRHEMQHVGARQLALYDALKQYKHYLKDSGGLTKGEDVFKEKTDYYWRVAWNEGAEKVIPHERIHYLDALQMVREYQQRGPDVESPGWMQWIKDKLK